METVIRTEALTHRYGRVTALREVGLAVPAGSLYALLGPNGAGKTTLLRILTGALRATSGRAELLGRPVTDLRAADRAAVGYVAEGQRLPGWMTLSHLESYLAPLYATWDASLAAGLRRRFRLDPGRKLRTLSRGERMKAALLCALAPRPRLLIMDEPFTGMDAVVKDELVTGLLELAGAEGWTVLVCSHDIGELESLADWLGFLDRGRLRLSEPMEKVRDRFRVVEVLSSNGSDPLPDRVPPEWVRVERSGPRARFLVTDGGASLATPGGEPYGRLPKAVRVDVRPASLREVFLALAAPGDDDRTQEVDA
jgi:ABC-2 type transport system ATP-binding protein